jgi:hypothetical protein
MSRRKKIVYTIWEPEDILNCLTAVFQDQKFQATLYKRANKHYDPSEFVSTFWELALKEIPNFNIESHLTPKELIQAILVKPDYGSIEDLTRNKLLKYLKILFLRIPSKLYEEKLPLEEAIDIPIQTETTYPNDFLIFIRYHLQEYLTEQQYKNWLSIIDKPEEFKKSWKSKHLKKIINKAYNLYKA